MNSTSLRNGRSQRPSRGIRIQRDKSRMYEDRTGQSCLAQKDRVRPQPTLEPDLHQTKCQTQHPIPSEGEEKHDTTRQDTTQRPPCTRGIGTRAGTSNQTCPPHYSVKGSPSIPVITQSRRTWGFVGPGASFQSAVQCRGRASSGSGSTFRHPNTFVWPGVSGRMRGLESLRFVPQKAIFVERGVFFAYVLYVPVTEKD